MDIPLRQAAKDIDAGATDAGGRTESDRRLPGDAGFWTFLAADATLFALLFFQFSLDSSHHGDSFDAGRGGLLVSLGAVNTVVLVSSSWSMARGIRSAALEDILAARRWTSATIGLGVVFAMLKVTEYVLEIGSGHTPSTSPFFMYYFVITGIHLLHLVAGVIALTVISQRLRRGGDQGSHRILLECGASYWHLIDLLWMFIFPLLYLAR